MKQSELKYMNYVKLITIIVSSGLLFNMTPLQANTDAHAKDKAFIKSAIQKMNVATQSKDLAGFLVFLHPDYKDIGADGKVNAGSKAQMRDQMIRLFARATSITVGPTTVTRFVFEKQGVTIYESGSLTLTLLVSGQESVIHTGGTYRDFWVKSGTGWLEKSSYSLSSKSTLNGKPVP